jgi:hypothetical protein
MRGAEQWAKSLVWGAVALLVVVALTILSGCVTSGVAVPDNRTVTNTVLVPIAAPCFDRKSLPQLPAPTPVDPEKATTAQLAAAAAADAEAFQLYARTVAQMWEACLKASPATEPRK